MKHLRLYQLAAIAVVLGAVFLAACGSSHSHKLNNNDNATQPAPTTTGDSQSWRTQIDLGKNIGLEVTLVSDSELAVRGHPAEHLGFAVSTTTHAGDLMSYDMVGSSQLENGLGQAAKPLGWQSFSDD